MALAAKRAPLLEAEERQGTESDVYTPSVAHLGAEGKTVGTCLRCHRRLTNPHSVARMLGPVCYRKAGGGAFDADLEASDQEWADREEFLRRGCEEDFGYWDWVEQTPDGPVIVTRAMRVSVRWRDGAFEAYGEALVAEQAREQVFYRGPDVREAWRAAVAAGPESNARAYAVRRELARAARGKAR